tara:strand:- start:394 stop:1797 length:1404 start_codon:yes stop_codon:yes gene_type:complete
MNDKILLNFFKEIHDLNIEYVVWKNSNLINNFFLGIDNLDIYIDNNNYKKLKKILSKYKWLKLVNNLRNYKFIDHYFLFTRYKTYHLHIYSRLITGDSILKEYDFSALINTKHKFFSTKYNLWILDYNIQFFLFKLRFIIKNNNILGKLLLKKQKEYYINELIYLKNLKTKNNKFYNGLIKKYYLYFEIDDNLKIINFQNKRLIINNLNKFKIRNFLNNFYIYSNFIIRIFQKKLFKRKSFKLEKGLSIFISGCDASGKSTILNEIYKIYKNKIDIKTFTIAKPYPNFIINFAIKKKYSKIRSNKKNYQNQKYNFLLMIRDFSLSILRYIVSIRINKYKKNNYLVICDRYVSNYYNQINGPRISNKNIIYIIFRNIELFFYSRIKSLEIEIRLRTKLDIAILRNIQRKKGEIKNKEEIVERYHLFEKSIFKSEKIYEYQNNKYLPESINDLLILFNKIILSKTNDYY